MTTFVSVGNAKQPFGRLINAIGRIAATLPQPVVVQHGSTPVRWTGVTAKAFIDIQEFERLVAGAALLVMHAGAGSVIHAVRAGKVPVIVPRRAEFGEHVDDHQVEFATALVATGRVIVALDTVDLEDSILRALACQAITPPRGAGSGLVALVGKRLQTYAARLAPR